VRVSQLCERLSTPATNCTDVCFAYLDRVCECVRAMRESAQNTTVSARKADFTELFPYGSPECNHRVIAGNDTWFRRRIGLAKIWHAEVQPAGGASFRLPRSRKIWGQACPCTLSDPTSSASCDDSLARRNGDEDSPSRCCGAHGSSHGAQAVRSGSDSKNFL
jgi:hypothetical protein